MTATSIQTGFAAGEVSPSLFGRTDLAKYRQGAFTMRNFFVNYRGGADTRPGTALVGRCFQTGPIPPRDIPFQFSITQGYILEFGQYYMRVKFTGAYVTEVPETITGCTATAPMTLQIPGHNYNLGDWLFVTGMVGLTVLNGLTWVISGIVDANHVTVVSLFGDAVTAPGQTYTSGGTAARIYTLATPWAAVDLPYLKFTQSADTMTLCCVNTATLTEYPSYELVRHSATNWTLSQDAFASSVSPPTGLTVTAQASTTLDTYYSYVVTRVSGATGEESIASAAVTVENNDISVNAGSNTLTWSGNGAGAGDSYNIYASTPSYSAPAPIGSAFGYVGSALGTSFVDTNITADFTQVPPTHQNPFARGAILDITVTGGGSGYTQTGIGYTITTSTGSGFVGVPLVVGGALVAFLVENGGANYANTDTIAITGGTGATATLGVGPQSGTYPGCVAYYQQRRVYAASLNNPDTYWMSQPGAFSNMDISIPATDSDAIVGTPWGQQVDGIQFMLPMPGGLLVMTGKGAWQVNGGNAAAITPADQDASPQAFNGCNNICGPLLVNHDILYPQAKGSQFRDLSYNLFLNIYTGTDLTVLSNHLFSGYTFAQCSWAEEPFKIAWAVRNDGALLSLTYLKEQDVYAWTRHDTNGQVVGVCSITEPPVDAVYLLVSRTVRGQQVYYSERMDNRLWPDAESSWCVDCGLAYRGYSPPYYLTPSLPIAVGKITSVNLISGGSGYDNPYATAVDPTGGGSGATFSVTTSNGVIDAIAVINGGSGYGQGTYLNIASGGVGGDAAAQAVVETLLNFTSSGAVFALDLVGNVIRAGGGKAVITNYVSATEVVASVIDPIVDTVPNDPLNTPVVVPPGTWSLTTPLSVLSGLNHLEGLQVAILADGGVMPQQTVTNGTITLPTPASSIVVGLPFTAQLQTGYLDPPGQQDTPQGKRKNVYGVTARMQATRGVQVGSNQPDASAQPNGANVPWSSMIQIKERNATVNAGSTLPLFTGDRFLMIDTEWNEYGQMAIQQQNPLPASILGVVGWHVIGDTSA